MNIAFSFKVSHKIHVASFAPNLMMAIGVAMSVDYSLFCLSRYREAMRAGADNTEAVVATLWSAGKVNCVWVGVSFSHARDHFSSYKQYCRQSLCLE